jgi:hypothetical protein
MSEAEQDLSIFGNREEEGVRDEEKACGNRECQRCLDNDVWFIRATG